MVLDFCRAFTQQVYYQLLKDVDRGGVEFTAIDNDLEESDNGAKTKNIDFNLALDFNMFKDARRGRAYMQISSDKSKLSVSDVFDLWLEGID